MSLLSNPLKTIIMYWADTTGEVLPESYEICDGRTLNAAQQDINPGGTYTLPNMINAFPLGADLSKTVGDAGSTASGPAGAPGPQGTGGTHAKSLTIAEIPSHVHNGTTQTSGSHSHTGSSVATGGDHTHTGTTNSAGAHTHPGSIAATAGNHKHQSAPTASGDDGQGTGFVNGSAAVLHASGVFGYSGWSTTGGGFLFAILNTTFAGDHTHTITITEDGAHTHSITMANGGAHSHSLTIAADGTHSHSFTSDATGGGTAFDMRPRFVGVIFAMKVKK